MPNWLRRIFARPAPEPETPTPELPMKLIVGLGNPGSQYAHTRHNVGAMAIDRLAQRHDLPPGKSKFHSNLRDARIADHRCLLLQPMTYMNRSGRAVAQAMRFYKLRPHDILILVDDVSLPLGRLRLRPAGSPGGHNGLADIQQHLATKDYPRLRIGIDSPQRQPQRDYVLEPFSPQQRQTLDPTLDTVCDCVEAWLALGLEKAMSRFNAAN